MSYGSGVNAGRAQGRADAESDRFFQEWAERMRASGTSPARGLANLLILCLIISGTTAAVVGIRAWIHDMPFFLHHSGFKNAVYWTVGVCSYSLLWALREFIRVLMAIAFFGVVAWMAFGLILSAI